VQNPRRKVAELFSVPPSQALTPKNCLDFCAIEAHHSCSNFGAIESFTRGIRAVAARANWLRGAHLPLQLLELIFKTRFLVPWLAKSCGRPKSRQSVLRASADKREKVCPKWRFELARQWLLPVSRQSRTASTRRGQQPHISMPLQRRWAANSVQSCSASA
jgi:hypothetical protein